MVSHIGGDELTTTDNSAGVRQCRPPCPVSLFDMTASDEESAAKQEAEVAGAERRLQAAGVNPSMYLVDTVEDLRGRCGLRASEYDVTQAAGLMRRLLLDSTGLVAIANRGPRMAIEYRWFASFQYTAPGGFWMWSLASDPDMHSTVLDGLTLAPGVVRPDPALLMYTGKRDQFLQEPVIVQPTGEPGRKPKDEPHVKVSQLVSQFANRLGGVHVEASGTDLPILAQALDTNPQLVTDCLATIGRIIVHALEPLCGLAFLNERRRLAEDQKARLQQVLAAIQPSGGAPSETP